MASCRDLIKNSKIGISSSFPCFANDVKNSLGDPVVQKPLTAMIARAQRIVREAMSAARVKTQERSHHPLTITVKAQRNSSNLAMLMTATGNETATAAKQTRKKRTF